METWLGDCYKWPQLGEGEMRPTFVVSLRLQASQNGWTPHQSPSARQRRLFAPGHFRRL